jgi:hypothetical protein
MTKIWHLKKIKSKFLVLGKFQCILLLNSLFDGGLFSNFYFEATIIYFWNSHFNFCLCNKHIVIISKVHYESMILLKFIHSF